LLIGIFLFKENKMQQQNPIDLVNLFQKVTGTLTNNKETLNKADTTNNNHGDNMVDTFKMITQAMKEKQGSNPAEQLAYASQVLRQGQSGSSQLYANGLSQAAQQFQGQNQVTPNNAMTLIQTLLGGGQAPVQQQSGGLGGLLGSLLGGVKPSSPQSKSAASAKDNSNLPADQASIDVILAGLPPGWKGTLDPVSGDIRMETPYGFEHVSPKNLRDYVRRAQQDAATTAKAQQEADIAKYQGKYDDYVAGSASSGETAQQPNQQAYDDYVAGRAPSGGTAQQQGQQSGGGLDIGNLLNAGMSFMNTKSQGGSTLEGIVNALVSGSAMSNSAHRSQSGSLVANTFLQTIAGLTSKK
jgi:hypothetical protein